MTPVKVDDVPRRTHKAMRVGGMVASMFIERARHRLAQNQEVIRKNQNCYSRTRVVTGEKRLKLFFFCD